MSSRFQRFLLPGFAFKAVVIGGGYATGRELAEFFMPSGPLGGVAAMSLATVIWAVVCAATFLFARRYGALDYQTFVRALLGRAAIVFEVGYLLFVILILAVYGAAAGAIGKATLGVPEMAGTLALMGAIAFVVAFGNNSVERLFKYVSFLLYGVYVLFVILSFTRVGDRIVAGFGTPAPMDGWAMGGLTYAAYNIVGAVVILPVLRHLTSDKDAVIAGLIAAPLAMLPALMFFCCMIAYYPGIASETLPSDFLLQHLNLPAFHLAFQLMIFAALLESGTGAVHAINERISNALREHRRDPLGRPARMTIALVILVGCMLLAQRFGLVTLIARGYRALAIIFLAVYVLPLLTVGIARLSRNRPQALPVVANLGQQPQDFHVQPHQRNQQAKR